jgi:hypothetical protein
MEKLKMRNLILVLIVVLAATAAQADETVAFSYVDADGVVVFTDDEKQVPIAYKDVAKKTTLGSLGNYERFTPITKATPSRLEELRALNATSTPRLQACDGPVMVLRERRDYDTTTGTTTNSYNSTFYTVRDSCGNVKSVTRTNPRPLAIVVSD